MTTKQQQILELHEAAAWTDFSLSASRQATEQNGIQLLQIGTAAAYIVANIDVLAFNRVVGLGVDGPVDDTVINSIVEAYSSSGVPRFFVQLSPLTDHTDLAQRLTGHGFRRYNNWMKLSRGVDPPPEVQTDLHVEAIGSEHSDAFARLLVENFDWPDGLVPWIAASVGRDGWHHYLAFDGERPVATAAMFIRGTTSWIDFASTHPDARGRGAQSALAARRIVDCAKLGCNLVIVETAEQTKDKPAPSFRNMRRFGFEVAYARPNYIFEIQ
jgi:GNAT superfamily N-acetyltransferase